MIIENPVYTLLTEQEAIKELLEGRPVIISDKIELVTFLHDNVDDTKVDEEVEVLYDDYYIHTVEDLNEWSLEEVTIRLPLTAEQLIDSGIPLVATSGSCIQIISSTTKPSIYDNNLYYTSESTEHYLKEDLVFQYYGDSLSYCTVDQQNSRIVEVER